MPGAIGARVANEETGFDQLADRYDAWYTTPVGAWADRYESEAVFRLLALEPGEQLLDLGTGTGRHAAMAADYGAHVTGVDQSDGMLAVAKTRTQGRAVTIVHADARRLPFPDESFDAVLAVTALCFAANPAEILAEAARVLRPGGRLVIGELNRWSVWALFRRLQGLVRPTTYRHAHFRGIRELRRLLVTAGFTPTHWEGLLHLPPINHAGFLRRLDSAERLAQRVCPAFGAFLAIEARRPGDRE